MKKLFGLIAFVVLVAVVATVLFFYGRGFRFDFEDRSIRSTSVITITSNPSNARVFINGEERGLTNLDIQDISPGEYELRLVKEGFSTWEKTVILDREQVERIEVVLFPLAPNLNSLTFSGIQNPVVTPNKERIIFSITSGKERAGVWSINLSDNPLPIFFSQGLTKIVSDNEDIKYSQGRFTVSPDSNQVLVSIGEENQTYYIVNLDNQNQDQVPIEKTEAEKLISTWQRQKEQEITEITKTLGEEAVAFSKNLENISVSEDEKRFFGINSNGDFLVFDSAPNPLPGAKPKTYTLAKSRKYLWYPDSKHLISVTGTSVSIQDVNGENKVSIYSAARMEDFLASWTDGSRVVILANFNPQLIKQPNLYSIQLR